MISFYEKYEKLSVSKTGGEWGSQRLNKTHLQIVGLDVMRVEYRFVLHKEERIDSSHVKRIQEWIRFSPYVTSLTVKFFNLCNVV